MDFTKIFPQRNITAKKLTGRKQHVHSVRMYIKYYSALHLKFPKVRKNSNKRYQYSSP